MYSKHFSDVKLAPGVWAVYASRDGAAFGNAAVIDLGEQTLVFDTFLTPQAGRDLHDFAEAVTGRVPELVVNSHYHNDHTWGNQAFPEAHILSSEVTRQQMAMRGQTWIQGFLTGAAEQQAAVEQQLAIEVDDYQRGELITWGSFYSGVLEASPELRLVLPHMTFEQHLSLHGTRQRVELLSFEGGHTASDTVLFLPEAGIVFLSDLLFIGCHPLMMDGDPHKLKAILNELMGMDADTFVPGHGPAGRRADLQRLINYVDSCSELACACESDQELTLVTPTGEFESWAYRRFFEVNLKVLRDAKKSQNRSA
jgi:cyclase